MILSLSDNLFLRTLNDDDKYDILDNISEEVIEWLPDFPWPYTIKDAEDYIDNSIINLNNGTAYDFGIVFKNKIVGTISLYDLDKQKNVGRLAYLLNKEYWGRKIISKSIRRTLEFGFNALGLKVIFTGIISENKASEKVLLKNSFIKKRINKHKVFIKSKYYDEIIYELSLERFTKLFK